MDATLVMKITIDFFLKIIIILSNLKLSKMVVQICHLLV